MAKVADEIKCINNILKEATDHGGDHRGPYGKNETGLVDSIHNWLQLRNLIGHYGPTRTQEGYIQISRRDSEIYKNKLRS